MTVFRTDRSIPRIMTDLASEFPVLFRKEARLARMEMSEKMTQMGAGLVMIVAGAVLLIPALVILLQAAVAALQNSGFQAWSAALIAGGAALCVGIILFAVGLSRLRVENLVPERTINQIEQDKSVATQQMRSGYEQQRAA